jgi:hypothetical protein
MSRFHAPEGSVTEQSVRMAFNYEYMVPIEVAWDLEQQRNNYKEMWESWRTENAHNLRTITSLREDLQRVTEDCFMLRKMRQSVEREFHELHKTVIGGAK